MEQYLNKIINGDCLEVMKSFPNNSIDAIVTDPPYGLSFMGKKWDYDVPSQDIWQECLRVLKPGGYLLSFAGTRTQHRMAVNIEDAGFEIRDMIAWVYGSGFPKSLNIGKAVDKTGGKSVGWFGQWLRNWRKENNITQKEIAQLFPSKTGGLTGCVANWELGLNIPTNEQFNLICKTFNLPFENLEAAEREFLGTHNFGASSIYGSDIYNKRENGKTIDITKGTSEWEGWGTALKPALEPITVARKPLSEKSVAENVLKWGTGGINIDGSRVGTEVISQHGRNSNDTPAQVPQNEYKPEIEWTGRFPANLIHDGSDEVVSLFPYTKSGARKKQPFSEDKNLWNKMGGGDNEASEGSAARFFYCAKASKSERNRGCEGLEEKQLDESRIEGNPGGDNPRNRGVNKATNFHPTVKPIALMEYLVKLVSRDGTTVLDPFAGSGSTLIACKNLNRNYIGIERESEYVLIAEARLSVKEKVKQQVLSI